MKILIIDNSSIKKIGNDYYVYKSTGEFAFELQDLENKIEFFQFKIETTSTISDFNLKKNNISFFTSKLYSSKILSYSLAYLQGMHRILNSDCVYIFYPNSFSFLGFFAKIVGKRYGLYVRGENGIFSRKSKILYDHATTIFSVSHSFTDQINSQISVAKCHTVKPMILFSVSDIVEYRKYFKNNFFQILFLGRIDKDKGLLELISAVKKLRELGVCYFKLKVVGDGPYLEELKKITLNLGLSDFVDFLGAFTNLNEIKRIYVQSDIYILPTYHEGFPRTLYEAMIFGTPIITTFVGGIPGLMIDGHNCLKIEPKSVDSIVEKVLLLIKDPTIAYYITKNGVSTFRSVFDQNSLSHAEHLNIILKQK